MWLKAAVSLCALSAIAAATTFTWTGSGANNNWSTVPNWATSGGPSGFPDDGNDDAVLNTGFYVVIDANYTIDDMTISDASSSTFTGDGTAYKLTCDTIVLSGDNYGDTGGVTVTGLAWIETN